MISTELFAKAVIKIVANPDELLVVLNQELKIPKMKLLILDGGVF